MNNYKLLESLNYGGAILKNRLIFAPTTLGLRGEKYYEFIENIAKGGVAMIIIGDVPLAKSMFAPSLFNKRGFNHYKRLCDIAHKYDCKIAAQLHESDTNMKKYFSIMPKLVSKDISEDEKIKLKNEVTSDYISNIPLKKVKEITSSFKSATLKAIKAGFDVIQVHGDRMCGSFSSSIFNKRTDEYGGDIFHRALFAIESIKAVRKASKTIPIDFKLVVRQENPHYGNAGVTVEELKDFIPLLEKSGVTSFHVTLADHSHLEDAIPPFNHPYFNKQGCFLKFCDEVRKYTNLPICGVGALSDPDFIEHELSINRVDCIAMSRQLVADPNYINKLANDKKDEIILCSRCNVGCFGGLMHHQGVHCIKHKN